MATAFGKNTRLKFGDGASSETFATLGGEKSFDWTQASSDVDTSDKDGPSGLYVPGRISFTVSGNVKLPDPAFSRVSAANKNGTPINIEAVDGSLVRYAGAVTIGNLKATYDSEGAVPYSFDMTAYAPPTTNAIDAVAS